MLPAAPVATRCHKRLSNPQFRTVSCSVDGGDAPAMVTMVSNLMYRRAMARPVSDAPSGRGVCERALLGSASARWRGDTAAARLGYLCSASSPPAQRSTGHADKAGRSGPRTGLARGTVVNVGEAVEEGVFAGFPVTDLAVSVIDGIYHPVDATDFAYKAAAAQAFRAAALDAGPTVLEPVMSLEVVTPDECVGEVLGDLHARRGKITGIATRPGVQTVACFVPLASMFGYSTDLRSNTKGRATYSMEFDHYTEVPQRIREEFARNRS